MVAFDTESTLLIEIQSEGKKESGMNIWKCGMSEACINSSEYAMIWQLKGRYVVCQTIKAKVIIYSAVFMEVFC